MVSYPIDTYRCATYCFQSSEHISIKIITILFFDFRTGCFDMPYGMNDDFG